MFFDVYLMIFGDLMVMGYGCVSVEEVLGVLIVCGFVE